MRRAWAEPAAAKAGRGLGGLTLADEGMLLLPMKVRGCLLGLVGLARGLAKGLERCGPPRAFGDHGGEPRTWDAEGKGGGMGMGTCGIGRVPVVCLGVDGRVAARDELDVLFVRLLSCTEIWKCSAKWRLTASLGVTVDDASASPLAAASMAAAGGGGLASMSIRERRCAISAESGHRGCASLYLLIGWEECAVMENSRMVGWSSWPSG